LAKKQDLISLVFRDQRESHLPKAGRIRLKGLENHHEILLDLSNKKVREGLVKASQAFDEQLQLRFKQIKKTPVFLHIQQNYMRQLQDYFENRKKRVK
jgi:hypothetical protein